MRYREPRFPCRRPASLRVGVAAQCWSVEMTNISPNGARLDGAPTLPPQTMVQVSVPPLQALRAVVQWSRDGQVGLRFPAPLSARTLAFLRGTSGHRGGNAALANRLAAHSPPNPDPWRG